MEETITVGAGTKYPLNGKLLIPDAEGAFGEDAEGAIVAGESAAEAGGRVPAVVLVHGSGPVDMDETVSANKPFRDIAEALCDLGIASIRYDKRTFVYGKVMLADEGPDTTVEDETIADALMATALLREDLRIDPKRVFIIGHSLGGMLAPRIDAEGGDYAGIVIMAGSPRRLQDIMMSQNHTALAEMPKLLRFAGKRQVAKLQAKFDSLERMTAEESKKVEVVGSTYGWYFKEMDEHPAARYLEATGKPVLIMQGEKDFQVLPGEDFAAYRELCAGKPNIELKLYPGLNHFFMPTVFGTMQYYQKEYAKPQKVDTQVLADIAAWIHRH